MSFGSGGTAKPPIAMATLRPETMADMNRGRLRGWVFVGAALFLLLAALAWPSLLYVVISAVLAAFMLGLGVWMHVTLPDVESKAAT